MQQRQQYLYMILQIKITVLLNRIDSFDGKAESSAAIATVFSVREKNTPICSSSSAAKSAVFPRNWVTLTLLPWVEVTQIT